MSSKKASTYRYFSSYSIIILKYTSTITPYTLSVAITYLKSRVKPFNASKYVMQSKLKNVAIHIYALGTWVARINRGLFVTKHAAMYKYMYI